MKAKSLLHTVLFQDSTSFHSEASPYALGLLHLILCTFPGGQEQGKNITGGCPVDSSD